MSKLASVPNLDGIGGPRTQVTGFASVMGDCLVSAPRDSHEPAGITARKESTSFRDDYHDLQTLSYADYHAL